MLPCWETVQGSALLPRPPALTSLSDLDRGRLEGSIATMRDKKPGLISENMKGGILAMLRFHQLTTQAHIQSQAPERAETGSTLQFLSQSTLGGRIMARAWDDAGAGT